MGLEIRESGRELQSRISNPESRSLPSTESRFPIPDSRPWTKVSNPARSNRSGTRSGKRRRVQAARRWRSVLHPAAAAECDRHPAHGPCLPADDHGCAVPLSAHARFAHAVAGRHRPCRHRHAEDRREPARRRRQDPSRPGPREVHRTRLGVEAGIRLDDQQPDAPPRRLDRLVARALHDGRGPVGRRASRVRAVVSRWPALSRPPPGATGIRC